MKVICLATAATAACLIALGGPIAAQTAAAGDTEASETVDVIAPYVVAPRKAPPRRQADKTYTELIETESRVSFSGLDLKNTADQATLEARVKAAAEKACADLDRRFPEGTYKPLAVNKRCIQTATDEAMVQVRTLIAAESEK